MALKDNAFPDIQFEEYIDDPRPNQVRSTRRIGIVGTFRKGPVNTFRLLSLYDELKQFYGVTTHLGSVGVQAAMEQGADDFGLVRVLGAAVRASKTITFDTPVPASVTAGNISIVVAQYQNDNTTLVHSTTATLAVTGGQAEADIAQAAVTLINGTAVMKDDVQAVYDTAGDVILVAKTAGIAGNYIKVTLTIPGVGGAGGVTVSPSSATNMVGGLDGPKTSKLTIQDNTGSPANLIEIRAKDEGLYGDDIKVIVSPGTAVPLFNITVTDTKTNEQEIYRDLSLSETNREVDTDDLIALRNSGMIRVKFIGTNDTLQPATTPSTSLSGGSDGPAVTVDDYLAALKVLEEEEVNYILCPGQTNNAIRAALIAQAENSDEMTGFRVAILNADKNMAIEDMDAVSAPFNTTTGSAVMVAGWATYSGQPRMSRFSVSPDAFYAGHLVQTPRHVSPAARASSPFFAGVLETDLKRTRQYFNALTKARMEGIIRDPATGGYHCLNGRTLSSDGAWYWVSIRRVFNQIKSDIFVNTQWAKSQPNTGVLRGQLAQQLDALMDDYLRQGMIAAKKASVVDSTNNPLSKIASGYLRGEVYFVPVFPADHMVFGIHRYLAADVSIATATAA
jgi:hypothetical protein